MNRWGYFNKRNLNRILPNYIIPQAIKVEAIDLDMADKRSIPIDTQFKVSSKIGKHLLLSFIGISIFDGNLLFKIKDCCNSFNDYFAYKEDEVLIENAKLSFYVKNPQLLVYVPKN